MENRPDERPLNVEVFIPESVELIDPGRSASEFRPPQRKIRSRKKLALFLFLATCVSTFLAGTGGGILLLLPPVIEGLVQNGRLGEVLLNGLIYSSAVMLILTAHEMGHWLQARRYGVPASLPYFIPMPLPPLGTMGAVIIQGVDVVEDAPQSDDGGFPAESPPPRRHRIVCQANRKEMFDIAISGPLAGLVFALPIVYFGILYGKVAVVDSHRGFVFGDPLIFKWMAAWIHGGIGPNEDLQVGPLGIAGWVGVFITALNLIPIGQLDGGHILYTLIGKRAHYVAITLLAAAVGYMVYMQYYAYILMVVLLFIMGPKHPPTRDDTVPLGTFRVILGWLTLAFVIIGFTPTPIVNTP